MCIDGANLEETAVQSIYGCWPDLFMWAWDAYALTDDSWDGAGISDACNVNLPFAKVVNSIFLINYALKDSLRFQWHSTDDYRSASRAASNSYHGPFYMRFIEDGGGRPADSEVGRTLARDRINLHCPLFNTGSPSHSAGIRGGALVHEAWHHWQYEHDFEGTHPSCGSPPHDCDYYYFHGVGTFDFGWLDHYDTDPANFGFHSPYQIQVEFLADLVESSHPWVPTVVKQTARAYGNAVLDQKFKNSVGYRIGSPRPF